MANKMIQDISAFPVERASLWSAVGVIGGVALLLLGGAIILIQHWTGWFDQFAAVAIPFGWLFFFNHKKEAQFEHRRAAYREYLVSQDRQLLIRASASPELSRASHAEIIRHLNTSCPGWSLQ